eukprot:scaffold231829_cov32-Tisochrysis_lutea.AAC.5
MQAWRASHLWAPSRLAQRGCPERSHPPHARRVPARRSARSLGQRSQPREQAPVEAPVGQRAQPRAASRSEGASTQLARQTVYRTLDFFSATHVEQTSTALFLFL